MSDCIHVPYPQRRVDPSEPGVFASYNFGEGQLAQFSRYLNMHADYGAAYDLTTRVGTPGIGQGGGILGAPGSAWRGAAVVPVGDVNFSYRVVVQYDVAGAAWTMASKNGGHYVVMTVAGGNRPHCSFNGGATSSGPGYSIVGRGAVVFDALYDGTSQHAVCNGRLADTGAVAPNIGAAAMLDTGYVGTTRMFKVYNVRRTVAQARVSYVSEFARELIYAWRPERVGEGPAGGILTGTVGEGDWYCPLGAATLRFDFVLSARLASGGALALANAGTLGQECLAFAHPKAPAFGSWDWGFLAQDLACQPMVGLSPLRTTWLAAAAGGTYYTLIQVAAGLWQATLHRDNGAALLTVTHPTAAAVGDLVSCRFSRHPSGDWRLRLIVNGVVASSAAVANDVTYLHSNYVVVAPRKGQILGVVRHQGEAEPEEVPMPRW